LLVEDDPRSHSALRRILLGRGWHVDSAMTLQAGRDLLANLPEAVILDLMLPDGNGADLLEQIRAARLDIRVVVATGVVAPSTLEAIQALEPQALLIKPINLDELLRVLEGGS
jgi:DNA-binding response OmpR family regulator